MLDTPRHEVDDDTFSAFLDTIRRFVRERLVPAEDEVLAADRIPEPLLDRMRELGLFGLTVDPSFGGLGLSVSQYIAVILELSWAAPAFRSVLSISTGMATSALRTSGTSKQQLEWLPKIAAGAIFCFALTEPDTGSDSANLTTRAVRDGDDYVITGAKRYITNAPLADVVLVMARTSPKNLPSNGHISAFLVPTNLQGLIIGKPDKKMGQRGALTADVLFDEVRVPASALLGGIEGSGFKAAMQAIDGGRLSVAAGAIGYGRRIMEAGLRYATERKAFGEPIANFQLIQAMLADSKTELYAAECMLRDAVQRADRGENVSMEASCVKMFASEACWRIADRTVQIHGGAGYMAEYEAERFLRDARLYRIYEGTTQIQQIVIAKRLVREFQNG